MKSAVLNFSQIANKLDNAVSGADREPLNVMVQVVSLLACR